MQPYMSEVAIKRLYHFIDRASVIWEYGAGGSTYQACMRPNVIAVHSVESDPGWCEAVKTKVSHAGQADKLKMHFVDVHANQNNQGYPGPDCTMAQAACYPRALNQVHQKPDLVVVDGRYRVACAAHAYAHMTDNAILLVDDYGRTQYHLIERWFEKIPGHCDGRLVAFKKRVGSPPSPHDIKVHELCAL